MKTLAIALATLTVILLTPPFLLAKRTAPKEVAPIIIGDIEFTAPHARMACVEARDTRTQDRWWRQIYVVVRSTGLEGDVQDVFIDKLEAKDGLLIIHNEADGELTLDPKTMSVNVIKGSVVVQFRNARP